MLFDFDRVEVQKLEAQLGDGGSIRGSGSIGLFTPQASELEPLKLVVSKGKINQSIVQFQADGEVTVSGALVQPVVGGSVTISRGTVRPRLGLLGRFRRKGPGTGSVFPSGVQSQDGGMGIRPVSMDALLTEQWDFQEPLVLMGPGAAVNRSDRLAKLLPSLPSLRFRNLRLGLGDDLRVTMLTFISFKGGGQLLLNGPLDSSLVRGVIRLNSSGSLRSPPRFCSIKGSERGCFPPSLGLVPFVDIAMRSSV